MQALVHYLPLIVALLLIVVIRSGESSKKNILSETEIQSLEKSGVELQRYRIFLLIVSLLPFFLTGSGYLSSHTMRLFLFSMGSVSGVLYGYIAYEWKRVLVSLSLPAEFIKKDILSRSIQTLLLIGMNALELGRILL